MSARVEKMIASSDRARAGPSWVWRMTGLAVAIACLSASGARAVTILHTQLSLDGAQYKTMLKVFDPKTDLGCDFSDPVTTMKGCQNGDGSFTSPTPAGPFVLTLGNNQNDGKTKTVLLTIYLNETIGGMFVPTQNERPGLSANYSRNDPKKAKVTFTAESWVPEEGELQFEWEIYPQPAAESITFTPKFMEGIKNPNPPPAVNQVPFDTSWIEEIDMESHCPEPDTWAMMVIGAGVIGCTVRRRRAATA